MTEPEPCVVTRGRGPLLVSIPHAGTHLPTHLEPRLTSVALALPDTDWHIARLYDFLPELDATVVRATHARYVIDVNRPPDGANLYPGQDTPALVPVDTFAKEPVWLPGHEPTTSEVAARRRQYWEPYHAALTQELARLQAAHGWACLWDAHSIRSLVPRFAATRLPDLSLGTGGGATCAGAIAAKLLAIAQSEPRYTSVLNGRFQGGYITRHYGKPDARVHAVQLELAQCTYMQEDATATFRDDLAAGLRPLLHRLLTAFVAAAEG